MNCFINVLQFLKEFWEILVNLVRPVIGFVAFVFTFWRKRKALNEYREKVGEIYNDCCQKILFGDKNSPRYLFAEDETGVFYVPTTIKYGESEPIHNANVDDLLKLSSRILICGESGSGKSIFARYLAADAAKNKRNGKEYYPVLLDLQTLNNLTPTDQKTFLDVLKSSINKRDLALHLEEKNFEEGLKNGDYLIILDGLDMLQNFGEWWNMMRSFFGSYQKSPCVITTRPLSNLLHGFDTVACIQPLDDERAKELLQKLDNRQHESEFYSSLLEEHAKIYQNYPLTLAMFYIVFRDKFSQGKLVNRSPQIKAEELWGAWFDEFYNQAKEHKRLRCALDLEQSKRLFSAFCFDTLPEKTNVDKSSSTEEVSFYQITEENIKKNLRRRLAEWGLEEKEWKEIDAGQFLSDLCEEIHMLKRLPEEAPETKYEFPHTSFQTYFAAYYLKLLQGDEKEKEAREVLKLSYWDRRYFYQYLMGIDYGPFMKDVVNKGLREIWETMKREQDDFERQIILLKTVFCGVTVTDFREERQKQPQYDYRDLIYYFQTYQGLEDGFRLSSLLEVFREFAAHAKIPDGNIEPNCGENLTVKDKYGRHRFEYRRTISNAVANSEKTGIPREERSFNSEGVSKEISHLNPEDKKRINNNIHNRPPLYQRCLVDGNPIQKILLFENIDDFKPKKRRKLYEAILQERRIPEIWRLMRINLEIKDAIREELPEARRP